MVSSLVFPGCNEVDDQRAETIGTRRDSNVVSGGQDPSDNSLKSQALTILRDNCASCHNSGSARGGFGIVLDVEAMKTAGYIIPGNAERSLLIRRLSPVGNMPPNGQLSLRDQDILVEWIEQIPL